MGFLDKLSETGNWIYDHGPLLFGIATFIAFTYCCWTRSLKGMILSGVALISSLVLGW